MRILVLAPAPPSDRHGGGALRMLHITRFLAERFAVDLVAPAIDGVLDAERLLKGVCADLEFVPPAPVSWFRRVGHLGPYVKDPALQEAIHRRLTSRRYGAVQLEKPAMIPYLPLDIRVPVVLDVWAFGLTGPLRALRQATGALRKARTLIQLCRYGLFDLLCWPATSCVLVVSEEDRIRCERSRRGRKAVVVPNGVDCAAIRPRQDPEPAVPLLLFTGDLGFEPNVDAACYLAMRVFPEIRRLRQDAELHLVGRNPDVRVRKLAGERITVIGDVPDMVPHLHAAAVYVAPHFTGAGTRTKVLEAMAAGLPIVTTTIGLEGIGALPGRDVIVADDADAMIAAISRLLDDSSERRRLGMAARRLVEAQYDWPRCLAPLDTVYRSLLAPRVAAC